MEGYIPIVLEVMDDVCVRLSAEYSTRKDFFTVSHRQAPTLGARISFFLRLR